jgi:GMP synthase (glutamine-hydrolysing)
MTASDDSEPSDERSDTDAVASRRTGPGVRRPKPPADQPRIALLNAAQSAAETRANFRRVLDVDLVEFHAPSGEFPETLHYDGVVVTGSWASVYWDREWIARLKSWVGDAVKAGIPTLGVCYGHQLLADVLGGRVAAMDGYEIGYRTIEHDGENELLEGVDEQFVAFTTHSDRVVEAPPGATVFAKNDYGIHGFRRGNAFAVQFHPEYDREMAEHVTRRKEDQLSEEHLQAVLDGITDENDASARQTTQVFDNFVDYVLAVTPERVRK